MRIVEEREDQWMKSSSGSEFTEPHVSPHRLVDLQRERGPCLRAGGLGGPRLI